MKINKKIILIIEVLLICFGGFLVGSTLKVMIWGASKKGIANSINEVDRLIPINIRDILGDKGFGNRIEYYIHDSFDNRGGHKTILKFSTDEKSFKNMFLRNLEYQKINEHFWASRGENYTDVVRVDSFLDGREEWDRCKKGLMSDFEILNDIGDNDYYAYKRFAINKRSGYILALFDEDSNRAVILIRSSLDGD